MFITIVIHVFTTCVLSRDISWIFAALKFDKISHNFQTMTVTVWEERIAHEVHFLLHSCTKLGKNSNFERSSPGADLKKRGGDSFVGNWVTMGKVTIQVPSQVPV